MRILNEFKLQKFHNNIKNSILKNIFSHCAFKHSGVETNMFPVFMWIAPFFSGVLLANMSKTKMTFKIPRWIIIPVIATFLVSPFTYRWSKAPIVVFGFMWIISVNFIIFACSTGRCVVVNRFLSLNLWSIPAKMSLSIYLIAPIVQTARVVTRTEPFKSVTTTGTVRTFFGFLNYLFHF
jgi:hypothetical protein